MDKLRRRKSDLHAGTEYCRRFGVIAVHRGIVVLEQVKQALVEQLEDDIQGREHRLLGTILYEHGWITQSQIESVLADLK